MTRADLGTKRTDPETGKKFYDFGRDPIVSPYTGTSYPLSFFNPPSAPAKYGRSTPAPVHREEPAEEEAGAAASDEDADTVSLSDLEEDEGATAKRPLDEDDQTEDDTVLPLDDDDVEDVYVDREEDDD